MYGKKKYGTALYSDTSADEGSRQEYYVDLTKLVPEFVMEKVEMKKLYIAQGYEIGYFQHVLEDIIKQCFIETATWGLERWEGLFGIKTNHSLTYEQRREILRAKLRVQGTTTMQMIKDTAAAFSGGDVDVIEDNAHSRFVVRFVGIKGIPRNMQDFISMLEQIKPAHLDYGFEYRYTIWDEITAGGYAWEEFKKMTWDDVRIIMSS